MMVRKLTHPYLPLIIAWSLAVSAASAQTQITTDTNRFTPAQDVQLGLEAAQEVQRELPLMNDDRIDNYVERIGERLAAAIPPQFQHPEFRYTFAVVNQREINAFALPGGPMFLNRGMIEAARSEGEVAGVMAHEISHVALRHGTAQATKAQKFQIGSVAGQVLGAIVGGAAGSVIAQGSQFGLGAYFLVFGAGLLAARLWGKDYSANYWVLIAVTAIWLLLALELGPMPEPLFTLEKLGIIWSGGPVKVTLALPTTAARSTRAARSSILGIFRRRHG